MCLIAQNRWGGDRTDYIVELIKNHSLGGVWSNPQIPDLEETMKKIKEAADYPVLIFTDAESGLGDFKKMNLFQVKCYKTKRTRHHGKAENDVSNFFIVRKLKK